MGKPNFAISEISPERKRGVAIPGEVKHPSTQRKRKQLFIPPVAASEKGGAQTHCFARSDGGCKGISSPT